DPGTKRYRLIHLVVSSVWSQASNQETDALIAAKSQLDAQQIVLLEALDEGPVVGTPATQGDLDQWIGTHGSNFTEMLDPGLANFGGFFEAVAVPWNADLDPRTMELLDSTTGWAGDVSVEVSTSVLPSAPSYPVPQCN